MSKLSLPASMPTRSTPRLHGTQIEARPTPNIAPSWNVAPTDPLPVVRYDAKAGERSLELLRWGLVPYWAKDIKVGFSNITAKAEGIEGKPAFREASSGGAASYRSRTFMSG